MNRKHDSELPRLMDDGRALPAIRGAILLRTRRTAPMTPRRPCGKGGLKMYRHTKIASALFVALVPLIVSGAALALCKPDQIGETAACPTYTAPATTAVPNVPMAASLVIGPGATTLFNGAVPPNGFMVQLNSQGGSMCWVNDNGPATGVPPPSGFLIGNCCSLPSLFVTPPGYKPIGPVSIWCTGSLYLEARGW